MPTVGKWTDETPDKPLTPAQRAALERQELALTVLINTLEAQKRAEEQKALRTAGCGTVLALVLGNAALWWWAIAQLVTLLEG